MELIIGLVQQTGLAILIMVCAAGGTIAIAELISRFTIEKPAVKKRKRYM